MSTFEAGQRVRIKPDAFPGSDDPADIRARGQAGVLLYQQDRDLWHWRGDDGTETSLIESELETVEDETYNLAKAPRRPE